MDDTSSEPMAVPLDLLQDITDGFSKERKLGSGTYGEVYLGVHQDGQKIAVKRIYEMTGVDDEQFQNEFTNLARLQHRNIVRLVGYCHHIQEVPAMYKGKLVLAEKIHRALCLEYMPNGSLEKYISDECDKYDWHTGYGIIKGICQGLKYLHTKLKPPIYHLDLKPANVLLDENMVPRIADFGISRLFGDERTRATKSTLGTQGYLPPEYIRNNLISSKFDIFSLGVVIIKIMAGRKGYYKSAEMSSHEFTNFVQENWTNRLHETSSLMNAYSKQVKICIEIGLSCVQEDRHKRPTIQNIVDRLNETETECTYAYKKFDVQENSGGLTPNYFMNNGRPVSEVPLNNDAGPSIQARTAWQYPTDMTAQQGHGQQDASMTQNGTPYYLPQANILNDQGSLSAQPTPFHNFLPVPADEMITGASLNDKQTEYFSTTLKKLENAILGPKLDIASDSPESLLQANNPLKQDDWRQLLKQMIIACGKAAAENDIYATELLISELRQLVSISGDPMQRLGAYMLEGLVARLSSTGSRLYKSLKCKEPTSSEFMSHMHLLCEICPFYKFGYMSAYGAIQEAIKGENFVHIIDFQITQGSQWITIIQALAARAGGPPFIRITGIDDSNSAYAQGGVLDMVGTRLHDVSASCGLPFEFNAVHAASHEVYLQHLDIRPFAYQLHHTPDESVSMENHRDRIVRMIKSLSPRVVTLVEQESNTSTTPFFPRYLETLDYYTAMFESMDVALPRDDKRRINTEQHCLARDIISLIACEGAERVERHEVFGKWKARFAMAGFRLYPLSSVVNNTIKTLLNSYHSCYRLEERDGVLYLGWKNRVLVVSSAWC